MTVSRKNPIPAIDTAKASRTDLIHHIEVLTFQLTEILPGKDDLCCLQSAFGISPQQAVLLFCLSDGHIWSQSRLIAAAAECSEDAEPQVIKVQISRLRKKMPETITIKTLWGFGYQLVAGAEQVRKAMELAL